MSRVSCFKIHIQIYLMIGTAVLIAAFHTCLNLHVVLAMNRARISYDSIYMN